MEKRIVDTKFMKMSILNGSQGKETPDYSKLSYKGESLKIIKAFTMSEAFGNKASFVALNRTIQVMLDLIDPFAAYRSLMRRQRHESPCIIVLKYLYFSLHSLTPARVLNSWVIVLRLN